MKKFEMPEVQVVTFEEDIMAINIVSDPNAADAMLGGASGNFDTDGGMTTIGQF